MRRTCRSSGRIPTHREPVKRGSCGRGARAAAARVPLMGGDGSAKCSAVRYTDVHVERPKGHHPPSEQSWVHAKRDLTARVLASPYGTRKRGPRRQAAPSRGRPAPVSTGRSRAGRAVGHRWPRAGPPVCSPSEAPCRGISVSREASQVYACLGVRPASSSTSESVCRPWCISSTWYPVALPPQGRRVDCGHVSRSPADHECLRNLR
jgi:hypothetical protein